MNRALINALNSINNLCALAIIVASTAVGFMNFPEPGANNIVGAIIGFVAGLIAAAIICGVMATFLEIEYHLRKIATRGEAETKTLASSQSKP